MLELDYLKSILRYDPDTGNFIWVNHFGRRILAGSIAGALNKGYVEIGINLKKYKAHRLAWFYMTGEWPKHYIDHKDRNKVNNKWENLREATKFQNQWNTKLSKNNRTGFKGVKFSQGKYAAGITVAGKGIYLGSRATPEEAHELYKEAALKYFGEFARFE